MIPKMAVFFLLINPLPRTSVYATYLAPFTKLNVHGSKIQKTCQGKACCKKGGSCKEARRQGQAASQGQACFQKASSLQKAFRYS